jgi:hypothetical protein
MTLRRSQKLQILSKLLDHIDVVYGGRARASYVKHVFQRLDEGAVHPWWLVSNRVGHLPNTEVTFGRYCNL